MELNELLKQARACQTCIQDLDHGVRPVLSLHEDSKILIIGQAPGIAVHKSGIPWEDKSGDNLRNWLGVDKETFYDPRQIGIMPMGFCYPGKGKSGDKPPRKECAPLWHEQLLESLEKVELTLLIGQYAMNYYLPEEKKKTLTEKVRHFEDFLPKHFLLPHPSPRNFIWKAKNPWFEKEVLPTLSDIVRGILM